MPHFETLTEFFAWLSVNQTQGNEYIRLGQAATYAATASATTKTAFANFLKTYLDDGGPIFNTIMQTAETQVDLITPAIKDEQTDTVKATITHGTLIW